MPALPLREENQGRDVFGAHRAGLQHGEAGRDSLGRPGSAAGVVVPVLMPSLPLVDRTKAALARRHGMAMGVAFLLPSSFIEHMAQLVGLDLVHPSWRPQGLAWRCFRHQLLLPRPYLVLTKPLRLDIQCQRGTSVKIGWKYLDD